ANLRRHYHLAKSITAAGWSQCLRIVSEKAACTGRAVVARAACRHQPVLSGLRRPGPQQPVRPLAFLPGVWHASLAGSPRRTEHPVSWEAEAPCGRAARPGATVGRWASVT